VKLKLALAIELVTGVALAVYGIRSLVMDATATGIILLCVAAIVLVACFSAAFGWRPAPFSLWTRLVIKAAGFAMIALLLSVASFTGIGVSKNSVNGVLAAVGCFVAVYLAVRIKIDERRAERRSS
jgi:hypothetical protein